MTIAAVAIRFSLATLVTGAGIGLGLHTDAGVQDPVAVPIVIDQPAAASDQSADQNPVAPQDVSTPQGLPEPIAEAPDTLAVENAPCTTPKPAGSWACLNGIWTMTPPRMLNEASAELPPDLTTADINPLTGTPVVTPTESTPLPGAGNALGTYAVAVIGTPGAAPWESYGGWFSTDPGAPSKTLSRPTPCGSQRPPGANYYCQNGTWMTVMPGAATRTSYDTTWIVSGPGAPAYIPVTVPATPVLDPIVTSYGCAGISPGAQYMCLNGSWVVR